MGYFRLYGYLCAMLHYCVIYICTMFIVVAVIENLTAKK